MNKFRRNTGLPSAFRMRLRRQIARADNLTDQQRIDLQNAIYDDGFIDELGNQTVALYGEPSGSLAVVGGFREWLAKVDWLKVIQIALTLLMLFLGDEEQS